MNVKDEKRKAGVERAGREAHLVFDCLLGPLMTPHKAVIPLTFKGRLANKQTLFGYDGPCHMGHDHSRTFIKVREDIANCAYCKNVTKPVEGSKCGVCGNPVEARQVWTTHYVEEGMRAHAQPVGRKKKA